MSLELVQQPKKRLRWYAVQCESSRLIVKAGVAIARLGVQVFMPRAFRWERRKGWLVAVDDGPLFPPYLFISMPTPGPWEERANTIWGAVAEADAVNKILGGHDRNGDPVPLAIPYQEMRKIRRQHAEGERKKPIERFKPNQNIKVVGGTFSGFDGIFDKPVKERVQVLINLFGRKTPIQIEENDIQAA